MSETNQVDFRPSGFQFILQDIHGIGRAIIGAGEAGIETIINAPKAIIDPLERDVKRVENQASQKYFEAKAGVWGFIGDTLGGVRDTTAGYVQGVKTLVKDGITNAAGGVSSLLPTWLKIVIVAGVAIYVLSVLSPFIRRKA